VDGGNDTWADVGEGASAEIPRHTIVTPTANYPTNAGMRDATKQLALLVERGRFFHVE
jgi:hypothetical protein